MMILCHNLQSMPQTKKLTAVNSPYMVGTAGFEPATPCPPDKCATKLRYSPYRGTSAPYVRAELYRPNRGSSVLVRNLRTWCANKSRKAQMNTSTRRKPRYRTSATTINLKCHGAFSSAAVSASLWAWPPMTCSPQAGHVPSSCIEFGVQYFAQGSHHGIIGSIQARLRTRSLIGVEPMSRSSRIRRSR